MKRDLFIIVLCFVAGMAGANVQPLLTGAGSILFPETSPHAQIRAAGGALTLGAGGANQDVDLAPSGTGFSLLRGSAAVPVSGAIRLVDGTTADNGQWALIGGNTYFDFAGGLNVRTAPSYATVATFTSTGLGIGVANAYPLDTLGDTNTSGVFRKAGTAGISATLTLPNGGSATISGGIITAKTDPTSTAISAQNVVTGSRALGTIYHNTTTRPIYVLVTVTCQPVAGSGEAQALTDAATPPTTVVGATFENNGTSKQNLPFWVLPGNYYSVAVVTNQVTLYSWVEWN